MPDLPQTLSAWVVTPSGRRDSAWLVHWSSCCLHNWFMGKSRHYRSQALGIFLCFLLHTQQGRLPLSSYVANTVKWVEAGERDKLSRLFTVWHQPFGPYLTSTSVLSKVLYQTNKYLPSHSHIPLYFPSFISPSRMPMLFSPEP